jgi:L-2,4-diaminobutyrate decarboxylase
MQDFSRVPALSNLRRSILSPDESNRSAFITQLEKAIAGLPMPADHMTAYLGGPGADPSWLAPYENISDHGIDPDEAVNLGLSPLAGQMRWSATTALHNVNQPVLLPAAVAHAITTLYNPNALWDLVSGNFLNMERQVVRQMAGLMHWKRSEADGLFTFGGKAGIMYSLRLGLNRCLPASARQGLCGQPRPVVLTTKENHYAVDYAAALLGLGRDNVIYVPTRGRRIDVGAFRSLASSLIRDGHPIACVLLCGGNTLDGVIDPLEEVSGAIDQLVEQHDLGYRPWVHFDLPLGWVWLFFRDYDFGRNPLSIEPRGLREAERIAQCLRNAELADSTCFDFHKLGFSPYSTSVFLTRHWRDLRSLHGNEPPEEEWLSYGSNFRQHHSLEHSRSAAPIAAAWTTLQTLGKNGFRVYLGHLHALTADLRHRLESSGMMMANRTSPSLATMFVPPLPGNPQPARPAGPGHLADAQNCYTESLFRYVNGLTGEASQPMAIGFSPGYVQVENSAALAALRIYLTNPHLNARLLNEAVDRLIWLRDEFDRDIWPHQEINLMERLAHTPK